MKYIVHSDINKPIEYVLNYIDQTPDVIKVLYINSTLPNKLFDHVNNGPYQLKHNSLKMQAFNYQKVNTLSDMQSLLAKHSDHVVVVEGLHQIIALTHMDYNRLNALIVDVLSTIRKNNSGFILDLQHNHFVDLMCDELVNI